MVRPITLEQIVEALRIIKYSEITERKLLRKKLQVSAKRTKEILNQLVKMDLIKKVNEDNYCINSKGMIFLEAFHKGDKSRLDKLLQTYAPYSKILRALRTKSASKEDLQKETALNLVAIDILVRLIRFVREDFMVNRITDRMYLKKNLRPSLEVFFSSLKKIYYELSAPDEFGSRKQYLKIPVIREYVCENLGFPFETFNEFLLRLYHINPDLIQMETAPYTILDKEQSKGIIENYKHHFYLRIRGE